MSTTGNQTEARDFREHGRYFFHYTTREAAFGHIVPDRAMRLSPYRLMRDPLEAIGPALAGGFRVPSDPEAQEAIHRAYFEAANEVKKARSQTKLLSLTIDTRSQSEPLGTFGSGWARARMWEQYAEQHQGVCLAFDREPFTDLVLKQLRSRSPDSSEGAVSYSDGGLSFTAAASISLEEGMTGVELALRHMKRHPREFFYLKVLDWASEHEYRFVEPSDTNDYSYVDIGDTLVGVIAGHGFPEWQQFSAIKICRDAGIELKHVFWDFLNRPMLGTWPAAREQ